MSPHGHTHHILFDDHYTQYSYWAYSKPYCRIAAYMVGVGAAWFILWVERLDSGGSTSAASQSQAPKKLGPKAKRALIISSCLVVLAVMLFMIFIPVTDTGAHKNSWTP